MEAQALPKNTDKLLSVTNAWGNARKHGRGLQVGNFIVSLVQTLPEIETFEGPKGLPDDLADAMLDGQANMEMSRWRPAVFSYGRAIELACGEFLESDHSKDSIGKKLAALREQDVIPSALVDFAGMVNCDRIIAVHYRKPITDAEARSVFALTTLILEYLYTIPGQIESAKARLKAAKSGED